jgi:opacity protein-like surface antigen
MNKKLLIGTCGLVAIAGNVFAYDEPLWIDSYVGIKGGAGIPMEADGFEYKTGFNVGGELGARYESIYCSFEANYWSNKFDTEKDGSKTTGGWLYSKQVGKITGGMTEEKLKDTKDQYDILVADGEAANGVNFNGRRPNVGDAFLNRAWYLSKMSMFSLMTNVGFCYDISDTFGAYAGIGIGLGRACAVVGNAIENTIDLAVRPENADPNLKAVAETDALNLAKQKLSGLTSGSGKDFAEFGFAYQFMVGVTCNLSDTIQLAVGYKLFSMSDIKEGPRKQKISVPFVHACEIGLRHTF